MTQEEIIERARVLLQAYVDMFDKETRNAYVTDIKRLTTYYDDCECDGWCLRDDMATLVDEIKYLKSEVEK